MECLMWQTHVRCVIRCPFLWSRCDRLLHRHCLGCPGRAGVHRHRPRQRALFLRGRVWQPLQVCTQDHPKHLPRVQLPAPKLRTDWRVEVILGRLNRTLIVNVLTLLPRWRCWIAAVPLVWTGRGFEFRWGLWVWTKQIFKWNSIQSPEYRRR